MPKQQRDAVLWPKPGASFFPEFLLFETELTKWLGLNNDFNFVSKAKSVRASFIKSDSPFDRHVCGCDFISFHLAQAMVLALGLVAFKTTPL